MCASTYHVKSVCQTEVSHSARHSGRDASPKTTAFYGKGYAVVISPSPRFRAAPSPLPNRLQYRMPQLCSAPIRPQKQRRIRFLRN